MPDTASAALVADIFGRTADLVDDAPLQTVLEYTAWMSFHHAAQAVGTEPINVLNFPAFNVLSTFSQNIFSAVHSDA